MLTFYAVMLPVVVLICGLSIDIGLLELKRVQMQSAADAAALGAALEAERGTNNWVNQGTLEAGNNGFTNGSNNVTVTVSQGATSGAYAGRLDSLQASITQNVRTIFMGALNGGYATVSAQAAALMTPCVYLTGSGGIQYYTLDIFTGDMDSSTCPTYINTRMRVQGAANTAMEAINIAGNASSSNLSGYTFPTPAYNVPAPADPLAYLTQPTFSGACNHTSFTLAAVTATLNPGTYCKGMTLIGSNVTLNPGLYVITGGALWSAATVTGTGVTLFFTKGGGATTYGKFIINLLSNVNLSAPNDSSNGGTPGILVFGDRSWVTSTNQDFAIDTSSFTGDGIWYLTGTGLYLWSCGYVQAPHYLGIVADNIYMGGTQLQPANNYSYVSTGNPFRTQGALVQ